MRKLKHYEYKLLRKVDFLEWKKESGHRRNAIVKRYHVQNPEDYNKYNKLVGQVTKLTHKLTALPPHDKLRIRRTDELLTKLYDMGVISSKKSLELCAKLTVSAFCRRRLPVVLVRMKFAESVREAVGLIEQGHLRIGPEVIRDPALLVTRNMADFITWSDSSKIKRKIVRFNDKLDDYDLLD